MESDQAKAAGNQNWYVLFRDVYSCFLSSIENLLRKTRDHFNVN